MDSGLSKSNKMFCRPLAIKHIHESEEIMLGKERKFESNRLIDVGVI